MKSTSSMQEEVDRLRAVRSNEEKEQPVPIPRKVYELEEVDSLRIENLALKRQLATAELEQVQAQMSELYSNIRTKLGTPKDMKLAISPDFKQAAIVPLEGADDGADKSTD